MPVAILDRLDEYRSDESLWLTVAGIFIGAALGLVTCLATGGRLGASAAVLLTIFVLMALLSGLCANRAHRRGEAMKRKILRAP